MKNYVIEYYEWKDPTRIFVKEVQAASKALAGIDFRFDPENLGMRISEITAGVWDKENSAIILY